MTPTTELLQETLTELYKRKAQYEALLASTNENIASHERVIKLIEKSTNE